MEQCASQLKTALHCLRTGGDSERRAPCAGLHAEYGDRARAWVSVSASGLPAHVHACPCSLPAACTHSLPLCATPTARTLPQATQKHPHKQRVLFYGWLNSATQSHNFMECTPIRSFHKRHTYTRNTPPSPHNFPALTKVTTQHIARGTGRGKRQREAGR